MEFLNLCLTILLVLLPVGNGFITSVDLCFLENSAHQALLLNKKQVVASEHFDIAPSCSLRL